MINNGPPESPEGAASLTNCTELCDGPFPPSSQVEVPSVGDESTDEVEIDAKLLSMRKETGTMRVVTGRGLKRGDTVICDFNAGTV